MKQMKKLASLLLALVMTLALSVSALAAGSNTITVKNAQANETYKIYKMLDLSVNDDKTAYTYTVNADWKDFFTGEGAGAAYVTITNGYVTWKANGDVCRFCKSLACKVCPRKTVLLLLALRLLLQTAILPLKDWSLATI